MKKILKKGSIALFILVLFSLGIMTACTATTVTTTTTTTATTTLTSTSPPTSTTITVTTTTQINTRYNVDIAISPDDGDPYLTDGTGRSLYYYIGDAYNTSNVSGTLLASWPVFYVASLTAVAPTLDINRFSSITRADGSKQTVYNGWPLYYYVNDKVPGDIKGDGVNNAWFLAETDDLSIHASLP